MHPLPEKRLIGTERKEIVYGLAYHRRRATDGTAWIMEVRRIVRGAAYFTDIAVLVSGPALGIGAGATNEAVGQKPRILLAIILCYRARHDMALLTQALEDIFRVLTIFRTVGRIITVKGNVEIGKVTLMLNVILGNKFLGCYPGTLSIDFDGRAMRIISAHIHRVLSRHFEKAHEDIGLDIFDEMAQVNTAVGIGQSAGDENWVSHGLPYICLSVSERVEGWSYATQSCKYSPFYSQPHVTDVVHGRGKEHRGATVHDA